MVTNESTNDNTTDGRLLTYKEAATYLHVPEATVRWWVTRGEIPFRKAGRHTRFDRAELDEWTKPTAKPDAA